jgi:thiosulfate reductase cytochrome b subunit
MQAAHAVSHAPHGQWLHPLPIRVIHWINAVTMIVMIGSGWKIYNGEVIFGRLHFYDAVTNRFRRMLLPVRWNEFIATIKNALRLRLSHDDPTKYNTVQKLLCMGVLAVGVMIVIWGLATWKPVQFSELLAVFGSFQNARLVHFLCMTAIVGFMAVHTTPARQVRGHVREE